MKNHSRLIVGIIIGVALSVSSTALAETFSVVGKKIEGEFPVTVNGTKLTTNAGVIEGTSYLPVRVISESLGLTVSFDSKEGIALKSDESTVTPAEAPSATAIMINSELEALRSRITSINKEIESYKSKLDKEKSLEKPDSQSISILEQIISECEKAIATKEAQITELEARLKELQAGK